MKVTVALTRCGISATAIVIMIEKSLSSLMRHRNLRYDSMLLPNPTTFICFAISQPLFFSLAIFSIPDQISINMLAHPPLNPLSLLIPFVV